MLIYLNLQMNKMIQAHLHKNNLKYKMNLIHFNKKNIRLKNITNKILIKIKHNNKKNILSKILIIKINF